MHSMSSSVRFVVSFWVLTSPFLAPTVLGQGMTPETKAWCERAVPSLREVLRHKPEDLARESASKGDFMYFELHGIGAYIPGVKSQECVRKAKLFKMLEGSSGAVCSVEHGALQPQAGQFAERYNQHIAVHRKAHSLVTCNED